MTKFKQLIRNHISTSFPGYDIITKMPSWLSTQRWSPRFLLSNNSQNRLIAIDVLLSGTIPVYQYNKIVRKLLSMHDNFRVIVVTLEESYEETPEIEQFCVDLRIGLKTITPGVGIQTIVKTDFDSAPNNKELPLETGWFPSAILEKAKGLDKLNFSAIIDEFIEKIQPIGDNEQEALKLVCTTIDKLLRYHTSFTGHFGQFMKLRSFEQLLRLTDENSSDHVFHSFRVFLAGCPIITEFYDIIIEAHKPLCKMDIGKLCVEYIWFLTAIFHDIGRPKEGALQLMTNTLDDEDLEISVRGSEARWVREHNINARRVLGSLGAFIVDGDENVEWDGGSIDDADSKSLTAEWINIYDKMKSHAVISAFDFLGDLFKRASAANERTHRPFILTHAAPAALSIMLHDWKIWPTMKTMKLIPVNVPMLPMAALLIYIDTWDNYKRRGGESLTHIKAYDITDQGACVKVEWGDFDLLEKDRIGYKKYKKALKNLMFNLNIKYGMVGEV